MSESRISPYSLNDLKNTTDDALGNYLRGLSFKEDTTKLDVRLALGYVAVIIAGGLFAADYKLGWEATKNWTLLAVVVYSVLNGAFTYWMWAVEKGVVFEGSKDGKKISISSRTNKHEPSYFLTVTTTSKSSPNLPRNEKKIQAPFTTWFTADGYFVTKPFQQWIATSIEAVGNVDVKSAHRDERDQLAAPSVDIDVLNQSSNGDVNLTGSDMKDNKGSSKRSKRKV